MMNFGDGLKEIVVGQKCVSYAVYGGGRYYTYTVKSIGRKLVTMECGTKFYLEDGMKQTEYIRGRLYSSEDAHKSVVSFNKLASEIAQKIDKILHRRKLEFTDANREFLSALETAIDKYKNEHN